MIRWSPIIHDLMCLIRAKFPDVDHHLPDERVTIAIIPKQYIVSHLHFHVPDAGLLDIARRLITYEPFLQSRSNYSGPDAVLIVCPVQ